MDVGQRSEAEIMLSQYLQLEESTEHVGNGHVIYRIASWRPPSIFKQVPRSMSHILGKRIMHISAQQTCKIVGPLEKPFKTGTKSRPDDTIGRPTDDVIASVLQTQDP